MLRIYDGEVFTIELTNCNTKLILEHIQSNPDFYKMVFLFTKYGKVVGSSSLKDFVNNTVILKTFLLESNFFLEAQDFCVKNNVEYGAYFPVVDVEGECVWLLYYTENHFLCNVFPQGSPWCNQFKEYDFGDDIEHLDFTLLDMVETYVFFELEEYTYAIVSVIIKKYPKKKIIFLDEKAKKIWNREIEYKTIKECAGRDCLYITSDNKNYEGVVPEYITNIYSSINVMYSLSWMPKKEHLGEKNKGRVVFIADFILGSSGLIDIAYYTFLWYKLVLARGWEFVTDYSRKPNQYLETEGENMWDYFFEPLSVISIEEANESDIVIRASRNDVELGEWINPYLRFVQADMSDFNDVIKFNRKTLDKIGDLIPEPLQTETCRVLGVVMQGTDYRKEANEILSRNNYVAEPEKVIKKCQYIMELWQCEYIFVATEDEQYFSLFKSIFGSRMLSVDQPRVYHDYTSGYVSVAELLDIKNGKYFGRTYLAVVSSLARCNVLLGNMNNGTFRAAKLLNNEQYEWCEII